MQITLAYINPLKNYYFPPLSLGYLKANTPEQDINIFEFRFEDSDEFMIQKLLEKNPDLIGFSCYVWNFKRIMELTEKVKQQVNTKILIGGPHVTAIGENILEKYPQIDFVIEGEGEMTFKELTDNFHGSLETVNGLIFRKGVICKNPSRENIPNLDDLKSPYLSGALKLKTTGLNPIETSRGCIFRCAYCFYHKNCPTVRTFSNERLDEEFRFIFSQGVKKVLLLDSTFNFNKERAINIAKMITKYNLDGARIFAEIKLERLDEELAFWLDKANIRTLYIGLQTTDPETLKIIRRVNNLEKMKENMSLLKKYNLDSVIQIINGLPGDNSQKFLKTLKFAQILNPTDISVFKLQVLPGTELFFKQEQYDFQLDEFYKVISNSTYSKEDLAFTHKLADKFMEINFSGNPNTVRGV